MAGNINYDAVLTTTLEYRLPKLVDNVFSARPFVYFLKQADQIKKIAGGHKIVTPLIYGQNTTVKSYSMYDDLDITPQDGISAAEYPWAQASGSISISGYEERVNRGDEEVVDLLEAKIMQTEETLTEWLDEQFITSNGTGNNGKDPLGLPRLVGQNSTAVGGIDPAAGGNEFWQSTINTATEALGIGRLTNTYNTVSVGADKPGFGLAPQDLYEKYESLLQPMQRFTDSKVADAGFQNLMFKGSPVCYDNYVAAGDWWWLNPKYLRIVAHKDAWFTPTPFVKPNNKDARYAQIILQFQLVCSNRARQARLTNKS